MDLGTLTLVVNMGGGSLRVCHTRIEAKGFSYEFKFCWFACLVANYLRILCLPVWYSRCSRAGVSAEEGRDETGQRQVSPADR